jgi:hypothetical protein
MLGYLTKVFGTMKRCWLKIQDWSSRRDQRALQEWALVRTKGRARYVIRSAMFVGLVMMGTHDLFEGRLGLFTIFSSHLSGLVVGFSLWRSNENRYKTALTQALVNAAPAGRFPQNLP